MGIGKATALTSIVSSILFAAAPASAADVRPSPWEREVVYQIFPRSFHDSNGDRIGDLKGIASKLGHLQKLGVTAILLNPVFASRTYHNYFADDFLTIDPEFGTNRDFFALVRQAHRRRMKVILDMEVQYVADRHRWFTADPKKDYLWREGSAFYGKDLPWYDGAKIEIAAINPDHPEVRAHIRKVFRYWADPNGDGNPSDGVDGFRIDHMMDDLDLKGVKKGMLEGFWRSLEQEIRRLNPKVLFVGEQSDWGLGKDLFEKADVDAVFALPLWYAIRKLEKDRLQREILATALATPPGKTQFLAIENHDTDRFASEMNRHPDLLRLGAVLNLTLKGTPVIYYGQELGMTGKRGTWTGDGNDIPMRLAYEWSRRVDAPGSAIWYRDTGPWWSQEYTKDDDGVSLEEEDRDSGSLFNAYRRLIALRKASPALRQGKLTLLDVPNPTVLAFLRQAPRSRGPVLVVVNLGSEHVTASVDLSTIGSKTGSRGIRDLWTGRTWPYAVGTADIVVGLGPYGFKILEVSARAKASP